ncbi:hypothetical protein Emag_001345 [Eimeria magna]
MYVSGSDSGGSFEFWGVPCLRKEEDISLPPPVHELEFIAVCPAKCFEGNGLAARGPVYGINSYAVESSICTAALHAGLCVNGAACEAFVTVTGPQPSFAAAENNGILSSAHGTAEKSIALAHASCTHSLLRDLPMNLKVHFGISKMPLPQMHAAAAAAAPPNFWSASVPHNGKYLVAVELGNPCGGGAASEEEAVVAFLEVNGQPLAQKVKIQKNKFYTDVLAPAAAARTTTNCCPPPTSLLFVFLSFASLYFFCAAAAVAFRSVERGATAAAAAAAAAAATAGVLLDFSLMVKIVSQLNHQFPAFKRHP